MMAMADYISREAVYSIFNGEHNLYTWYEIESAIDAIPAADVQPVVHGKWDRLERCQRWQCSVCGVLLDIDGTPQEYLMNFCPSCGADMREVQR